MAGNIPKDKALAFQPSLVSEYTTYRPKTSVDDSFSTAQQMLKNVARRLEQTRVEHEDKDLASFISSVDDKFKETMDLFVDREAFTIAVRKMASTIPTQPQALKYGQTTTDDFEEHLMERPAAYITKEYERQKAAHRAAPESERYSAFRHVESSYADFRKKIFYVSHDADQDMPDVRRFYADFNQDDEDLMVEEAVVSYICPLTKEYFQDPVTSSACGHTFSQKAIQDVFDNSDSSTIKCPVPACSHYFQRRQLQPNAEIAAKAKARQEREARETQRRNQTFERL